MASLRPPGLGPIVGATTATTSRIWIRADDPGDNRTDLDEDRRTVGVIGLLNSSGEIGQAWYFRLQREFDRTGTFVVGSDVQLGFYPTDLTERDVPLTAKTRPMAKPFTLSPDTSYTVRCGTLTVDDPMPNQETISDYDLFNRLPDINNIKGELLGKAFDATICEATLRTYADGKVTQDKLSFLLGSCRYPGLLWKIKEADRIFGPMLDHFADGEYGKAARYTVMCGDQIYADLLNRMIPILRADTFDEFQERYLTAYGAPNLRALMRKAPSYMILDDHEIEDNWTQDRLRDSGKHQIFNIAIGAYQSYQWSHGPRTFGRLLYYTFECGGYPTFVLDTRTQRYKDDRVGLEDNHLIGRPSLDPLNHPGQLQRLLDWLLDSQTKQGNVPKFIVTSSVFLPNDMGERLYSDDGKMPKTWTDDEIEDAIYGRNEANLWNAERRDDSDAWPAFPRTRTDLLKHIIQNKIQNVVFLAGDIHCSNTAVIEFDGTDAASLKMFAVTSSAFYWPFPFADGDPNNYVHDSRKDDQYDPFPVQGTNAVMNYKSFGYTQEDNFTRLDIDKKTATITVSVFDRDGKPILNKGDKSPIQNKLKLAPWS